MLRFCQCLSDCICVIVTLLLLFFKERGEVSLESIVEDFDGISFLCFLADTNCLRFNAKVFQQLDYVSVLPKMNRQASMAYPFFYLSNDGFWNLQPRQDTNFKHGRTIKSLKQLREWYYGAKFSDDLFPLLQMQTSCEKLRTVLIDTYFSSGIQQRLQSIKCH